LGIAADQVILLNLGALKLLFAQTMSFTSRSCRRWKRRGFFMRIVQKFVSV
jgi:hypothetical protein